MELGKVLATKVRTNMHDARNTGRFISQSDGFSYSTTRLVNTYLKRKTKLVYPEPKDVFPVDILDEHKVLSIVNEPTEKECMDSADEECTL